MIAEWHGCYADGWQGEIVPEAFAHPAKISRALIRRIYEHAMAEGWLHAGDTVIDPFGGICGTGLDAMWNGMHWIGNELEPRFVALGNENLDLWRRKYGGKAGFGTGRLLQGDSRKLAEVIGAAGIVVSSPPYAGSEVTAGNAGNRMHNEVWGTGKRLCADGGGYGAEAGQLGAMKEGEPPALIVSSPPYASLPMGTGLNTKPGKDGQQSGRSAASASQTADSHYGEAQGQLSTMREGDAPACIISSPPFSHPNEQPVASQSRLIKEGGYDAMKGPGKMARGSSDGNLEGMPEGRFDAVVSSPPYEEGLGHDSGHPRLDAKEDERRSTEGSSRRSGYHDGEMGTGDTFWQAAREIVAQCALILKPGGHAIWITKDFVRKGKRVPFSDQWQALCEQKGFKLVCRHQAMLVAYHGEQDGLFGAPKQLTTSRKSFFRRLAESKGSPEINYEDVICMVLE